MVNRLMGKVAVVTGSSKGIGAAIAEGLGAQGASVVVNYRSSKENAVRVVSTINASGGKALAVQGDVSKTDDVRRLFEAAKKAFGHVDVLVNNAGIYKFGPIEAVTEEDFHEHFNSNVLSVFLTIQEAVKQFGADGGSVINIVSAGVEMDTPMSSLYSATKSAVATITRVLAKDLGSRHIRVNAIAPGVTETEGLHALGFIGSGLDSQVIAATPLGRLGRPEDIAPVAVFLASDESKWITGDTLFASGGLR